MVIPGPITRDRKPITIEIQKTVKVQIGLESDVFVGNSSVDMYAKRGSIEDAWTVFNKMPSRGVVT